VDIVVVDIPDVWGMLLSRKFASKLGGTLEMDLTYVNIPLKDGTIGCLLKCTCDYNSCARSLVILSKMTKHMTRPNKLFTMLSPTFRDN
jgi:hypothetical protein